MLGNQVLDKLLTAFLQSFNESLRPNLAGHLEDRPQILDWNLNELTARQRETT